MLLGGRVDVDSAANGTTVFVELRRWQQRSLTVTGVAPITLSGQRALPGATSRALDTVAWVYFKFVHAADDLVARERLGNTGYDCERILAGLAGYECGEIDGSRLTDKARKALIKDARSLSMRKHVIVGNVFGSSRHPRTEFGTTEPALLVYDPVAGRSSCVGLYPHQTLDGQYHTVPEEGHYRTIRKYVTGIAPRSGLARA